MNGKKGFGSIDENLSYKEYCEKCRDHNKRVDGAIAFAEALSSLICESCGAKATKRTTGWIRNLCDECYDKSREKEED